MSTLLLTGSSVWIVLQLYDRISFIPSFHRFIFVLVFSPVSLSSVSNNFHFWKFSLFRISFRVTFCSSAFLGRGSHLTSTPRLLFGHEPFRFFFDWNFRISLIEKEGKNDPWPLMLALPHLKEEYLVEMVSKALSRFEPSQLEFFTPQLWSGSFKLSLAFLTFG